MAGFRRFGPYREQRLVQQLPMVEDVAELRVSLADLPAAGTDHRGVLAVLKYLGT